MSQNPFVFEYKSNVFPSEYSICFKNANPSSFFLQLTLNQFMQHILLILIIDNLIPTLNFYLLPLQQFDRCLGIFLLESSKLLIYNTVNFNLTCFIECRTLSRVFSLLIEYLNSLTIPDIAKVRNPFLYHHYFLNYFVNRSLRLVSQYTSFILF
jgi:hypothetical protein